MRPSLLHRDGGIFDEVGSRRPPGRCRSHGVPGARCGRMLVFAAWPFARLVRAFRAPVGYLFRPDARYCERNAQTIGDPEPHRHWERVG